MATVGPASASCMIPRRAYWPWQKSLFTVNATRTDLFPTNLTGSLYRDVTKPTYNATSIPRATFFKPFRWEDTPLNSGMFSITALAPLLSSISGRVAAYNHAHSAAWMQSTLGAASSSFLDPTDASTVSYELSLAYPDSSSSDVATSIQVPGITSLIGAFPSEVAAKIHGSMDAFSIVQCLPASAALWNVSEPVPRLDFGPAIQVYLDQAVCEDIAFDLHDGQIHQDSPDIIFVDLPNTNLSGFVQVSQDHDKPNHVQMLPCTIELGWFPTIVSVQANAASSKSPPQHGDPGIVQAKANIDWLYSTNPWIPDINATAIALLFDGSNGYETWSLAISTMMTVTLARMSMIPVVCGTWAHYEATLNDGPWYCDNMSQAAGRDFEFHFPVQWTLLGYGYGPNELAVQVSIAILLLYCMIASAHIAWSFWTGVSSSAWDSVVEVVALAIASHPASEVQNTCAGINTAKVFEHRVRIATTTGAPGDGTQQADGHTFEILGDHLELLFPSNDQHVLSEVAYNRAYGGLKEKLD